MNTQTRSDFIPGAHATEHPDLGALREVPYMGVIFVVAEAVKRGFWNGHPEWSNLGQGQPEVGEMEGAPAAADVGRDPSRGPRLRAARRHARSCAKRSRLITTGSTAKGRSRATPRPMSASPRAGGWRSRGRSPHSGRSTSGISYPTTRPTRTCSTCTWRALPRSRCRRGVTTASSSRPAISTRRCATRASEPSCSPTRATRPATSSRAMICVRSSRLRAPVTRRSSSTSSTVTSSTRPTASPAQARSAPPSSSTTWKRTR